MKKIIAIFIFMIASNSFASQTPAWCSNSDLGYSFYCDAKDLPKSKKVKKIRPDDILKKPLPKNTKTPYSKINKQFKMQLEEAKSRAIISPTRENIRIFLEFQAKSIQLASTFANKYGTEMRYSPNLNPAIEKPQSKIGKQVWMDKKQSDIQKAIKYIRKNYAIVFFYQSTCPYCKTYAPILRRFVDENGIKARAISIDNGPIQYWKGIPDNKNLFKKWGLLKRNIVPATVLYNPKTKHRKILDCIKRWQGLYFF